MKTAPCRCRRPGRQSATEPVQLTMVAVSSSCPAFGHVTRWSAGLAHRPGPPGSAHRVSPAPEQHVRPRFCSTVGLADFGHQPGAQRVQLADGRVDRVHGGVRGAADLRLGPGVDAAFPARAPRSAPRAARAGRLRRSPPASDCGRPVDTRAAHWLSRTVPPDPGRPSWPGITGLTGDGGGPAGTG